MPSSQVNQCLADGHTEVARCVWLALSVDQLGLEAPSDNPRSPEAKPEAGFRGRSPTEQNRLITSETRTERDLPMEGHWPIQTARDPLQGGSS